MVKANPSWVARVWTNVAIDDYIQAHVAEHDWNLIKQKHIVEKTDLWRTATPTSFGDRFSPIPPVSRPFSPILSSQLPHTVRVPWSPYCPC